MTTISPVLDDEGNYLDSEITDHIISNDIIYESPFDFSEETGNYYLKDEYSVDPDQVDPDEAYEYLIETHPATSDHSTAEEVAAFWLDRGPISDQEMNFLVQVIAECEDPESRDRAEALLLFKTGAIEFQDLPESAQEALAEVLGQFDTDDSYDDSYADEDEGYEEEGADPELVEALVENLPDLAAAAEEAGDEVLAYYFRLNEAVYSGQLSDDDFYELMIENFGEEAQDVADYASAAAQEYLGIA